MSFIPGPDVLAAFTAASLVLILTPGPDMSLFLGQTLGAGRAHGFASMLGVMAGLLIHSMLAAFGLSALLAASTTAFTAIKIAGVVYLLWLALQATRHGSALAFRPVAQARRPLAQAFLMGLGVNLLNPKIIVFFITFLPQFISAADPQAQSKLLFLGLYFAALGLPICALLIVMADRFTRALRRSPRIMRAIDFLFAGLMGAFALRLLLARNP